jgi:PEP-CTERM motif
MIRRRFSVPIVAALTGLALVGATQEAQAGLLPTLLSVTPDGSNFKFFYSVDVPSGYAVKPGDAFTIYDFAGYVPGTISVSPAQGNWDAGVANVTAPPVGLSVWEHPTIPNLMFTFHPGPSDPQSIPEDSSFTFSADSTYSGTWNPPDTVFNVTSTTHRITATGVENALTNTGVPTSQSPEPASLALVGIGLPLMGAFQFFRRRRLA